MVLIGIICPLRVEAKPLLSWYSHPKIEQFHGFSWIRFEGQDSLVIVISKIGSAQAGKATQILIEQYHPELIVNFGSAGAISPHVKIGEVVVGVETAEYLKAPPDSDVVPSDSEIVTIAKSFPQIRLGPIVSADQNIENIHLKQELYERYQAICGDWESASVMKICREQHISAIPFRVVTDYGNEVAVSDFQQHHPRVLKNAADLLRQFLERWRSMG